MSVATKDAPRQRSSSKETQQVKHFTIRCIVWREGDAYLAECIDLDVSVRGKSEWEVQQKLMDAIRSYVVVALKGDPKGLLPRPAPLARRLRYHLFVALAALISTARRRFRLMELSSELACHSL